MQGAERSLVEIIKMAYFGDPLELLTTEEFEELRQWVEHHWPINHFANWQYGDKSPEEIQAVITSVTTLIPGISNDIHPKDVVVKVYGRYEEELARRVYEAKYPSTVDGEQSNTSTDEDIPSGEWRSGAWFEEVTNGLITAEELEQMALRGELERKVLTARQHKTKHNH